MNTRDILELIVFDRYRLKSVIAEGTRTKFCAALDENGRTYVAKLTNANEIETSYGTFEAEMEVLKSLAGGDLPSGHQKNGRTPKGFPNIFFVGKHREEYNIIVMETLATHLYDFNYLRSLSIRELQNMACDMLDCLMVLHQHGFVHREVKLQSFMLNGRCKVQLIDFSLSIRYRDPNTGEHYPKQRGRFFCGTIRYGSVNALRLISQSRRDDLESLGYLFVEMLKGHLPWDEYTPYVSGETEIQRMIRLKISSSPWTLCAGLPKGLLEYMIHVSGMTYDQTPDYDALREMLNRG